MQRDKQENQTCIENNLIFICRELDFALENKHKKQSNDKDV